MNTIIITGATGFIGRRLSARLLDEGYQLVIVSRNTERARSIIPGAKYYLNWNDSNSNDFISKIEGAKSIIHLAGKNIFSRRWSKKHKQDILKSRVETTKIIAESISKLNNKPESFICASATGYYGFSDSKIFNESSPPGNDYLAQVTVKWEEASNFLQKYDLRVVNVRTAVVVDKSGGIMKKLNLPFKLFMGGVPSPGSQWFPWISLKDLVNIYLFAIENDNLTGPVNAVADEHITMQMFCTRIGKVFNRPCYLKIPGFVLRIIFGEGAEYITKGAPIEPLVLKENGFEFIHTSLGEKILQV